MCIVFSWIVQKQLWRHSDPDQDKAINEYEWINEVLQQMTLLYMRGLENWHAINYDLYCHEGHV